MRVWSWNMYCYNKHPEAVINFLRTLDADIVCMQEVPEPLLASLTPLFPHHAHVVDSVRHRLGKALVTYNLILSRHPLRDVVRIPHTDLTHPVRTLVTIHTLAPLGWSKSVNRSAVSVVADTPLGAVQVYSAHLTLSSPSNRAREFSDLVKVRIPTIPAVIAGDFNIIEHPRVKPLSWFLGASLTESLPTYPERALFEERFKNAQFINPHKGTLTHHFSRSQLDHILVSDSLDVRSKGVHPELAGSDHYPVFVEVSPHV